MRDGASTNNVAVRILSIFYPFTYVRCQVFFTFLGPDGERFDIPVLNEFISLYISMFRHSPKARLCWREQTGSSMKLYTATRWWSKREVMQQIMVQFGDVEIFLVRYPDVAPSTNAKLRALLQDRLKKVHLQLELSSIIDWGEHFVKSTYVLEGDGSCG